MRLPNAELARIDREKLTSYLLSFTHPVGRSKARFFGELGFAESNVEELEEALLSIAQSGEVVETLSSEYGRKYVVDGTIRGSAGIDAHLRTIWIIESGESRPRFVTAYPR